MRLGGPRSKPSPHLKLVEVPGIEPATIVLQTDSYKKLMLVKQFPVKFLGGYSSHHQLYLTDSENSGGCLLYFPVKLLSEGISEFISY